MKTRLLSALDADADTERLTGTTVWGDTTVPKAGSQSPAEQREKTPEFYTVGQLADLLQLTEMTIYRMVNRRELPCYSIGRIKRFRRSDIEEFLDGCRVPAIKDKRPSR